MDEWTRAFTLWFDQGVRSNTIEDSNDKTTQNTNRSKKSAWDHQAETEISFETLEPVFEDGRAWTVANRETSNHGKEGGESDDKLHSSIQARQWYDEDASLESISMEVTTNRRDAAASCSGHDEIELIHMETAKDAWPNRTHGTSHATRDNLCGEFFTLAVDQSSDGHTETDQKLPMITGDKQKSTISSRIGTFVSCPSSPSNPSDDFVNILQLWSQSESQTESRQSREDGDFFGSSGSSTTSTSKTTKQIGPFIPIVSMRDSRGMHNPSCSNEESSQNKVSALRGSSTSSHSSPSLADRSSSKSKTCVHYSNGLMSCSRSSHLLPLTKSGLNKKTSSRRTQRAIQPKRPSSESLCHVIDKREQTNCGEKIEHRDDESSKRSIGSFFSRRVKQAKVLLTHSTSSSPRKGVKSLRPPSCASRRKTTEEAAPCRSKSTCSNASLPLACDDGPSSNLSQKNSCSCTTSFSGQNSIFTEEYTQSGVKHPDTRPSPSRSKGSIIEQAAKPSSSRDTITTVRSTKSCSRGKGENCLSPTSSGGLWQPTSFGSLLNQIRAERPLRANGCHALSDLSKGPCNAYRPSQKCSQEQQKGMGKTASSLACSSKPSSTAVCNPSETSQRSSLKMIARSNFLSSGVVDKSALRRDASSFESSSKFYCPSSLSSITEPSEGFPPGRQSDRLTQQPSWLSGKKPIALVKMCSLSIPEES